VVTSFTVRTFAPGDVATVNVQRPWESVRDVVRAWQAFAPAAPDSLSCFLALRPGQGGEPPRVAMNGQVFGTREQATSLIEPLVSVGSPTRVSIVSRPFIRRSPSGSRTFARRSLRTSHTGSC
jgi:hypothetical protein